MFNCNRGVLGVGDQLPGGTGLAAQSFENIQMIGAGAYDARVRAFYEGGHEREGAVKSGWRPEDSRVCYHADESGQNEEREGKGFRSRGQTSDPVRIPIVIVGRVLDVGIYEDVYVREQHTESLIPRETGLVVLCVKSSWAVEVDSRTRTDAAYSH